MGERIRHLVAGVVLWCAVAQAQTIGLNFTASGPTGFFPPDTMGSVGPGHIVLTLNGVYDVFDKSNGALLASSTLNSFWTTGGAVPTGNAYDPRIVYDPFSQRWFASSLDNARSPNSFLIGVSNSSNPLDGWTTFKTSSDAEATQWGDFDTLGFNKDGVFISANMFLGTSGPVTVNMLVVPKNDLMAPTPTISNAKLLDTLPSSVGTSLQPVIDMDNGSLPEPIVAGGTTLITRSRVNGPLSSPTVSFVQSHSVSLKAAPNPANQPGPNDNIDTGDVRLRSNAILKNGIIWAVQGVAGGNGAAFRWIKINTATNTIQEGLLSDPGLDFYEGSLAVNDAGDVVVGCTGSSDSQYASVYAFVGHTTGGVTTFGAPMLLQSGGGEYFQTGTGTVNRWGDYSATVLDPVNPFSFWTIQELATATDTYGIQVTQVLVPEAGMGLAILFMSLIGVGRRR